MIEKDWGEQEWAIAPASELDVLPIPVLLMLSALIMIMIASMPKPANRFMANGV